MKRRNATWPGRSKHFLASSLTTMLNQCHGGAKMQLPRLAEPSSAPKTKARYQVPKPANINPGAATFHELHNSNEPTPTAMSSPLTIKSHLPEICSASQSPVNLVAAMATAYTPRPVADTARAELEIRVEEHRGPIRDGSLHQQSK